MKNPNGYGSVVYLGPNRRKPYGARITQGYRSNGKPIKKYIGYYKTRKEAMIALSEYHLNPEAIRKVPTLQELYDIFIEDKKEKRSKSTIEMYTGAFNHVARYAKYKITDIKKSHIQDIINSISRTSETGSYSLCSQIKLLMSQIFDMAMDDDYITKNYAKNIILPEKKVSDKTIFTPDEIKKMFKAIDKNIYITLPILLIYTCMRPSELLKIRKFNVHINEQYMVGGIKTQAGKNRIIPINKKILPLVENWMKTKSEFLISKNNEPITYNYFREYLYYTALDDAGVRHLVPHKCRKTGISMLKNAGVENDIITRIAGHTDYSTTDKYYVNLDINTLVDKANII